MAIYKGGNQIGKLFVGGNQIGKIYKGSTLIYAAEEKFTDTSASIYHAHDEVGDWETFTIPVEKGETFRIDSITYNTALSYSVTDVQVYVDGTRVKDFTYTRGPQEGSDFVTVLTNSIVYTANGKTSFQIKTRGCVSSNQHTDNPRVPITVVYTTGV